MSDTAMLLKEIEGLPPDYVTKIFDFINQLKHEDTPVEKTFSPRLTRQMIDDMLPGSITESITGVLPDTGITLEKIRAQRLCKYL
jgi:hypothetical protein